MLAAGITAPLCAQFSITVHQNGQAFSISNGGAVTLNAPAVGQPATAIISLTHLGNNTATF